jgi:hypothetical protein
MSSCDAEVAHARPCLPCPEPPPSFAQTLVAVRGRCLVGSWPSSPSTTPPRLSGWRDWKDCLRMHPPGLNGSSARAAPRLRHQGHATNSRTLYLAPADSMRRPTMTRCTPWIGNRAKGPPNSAVTAWRNAPTLSLAETRPQEQTAQQRRRGPRGRMPLLAVAAPDETRKRQLCSHPSPPARQGSSLYQSPLATRHTRRTRWILAGARALAGRGCCQCVFVAHAEGLLKSREERGV